MMFIFWAKSTSLKLGMEFIFYNECTERFLIFIIFYNCRHIYLVSTESIFKDLSYCFYVLQQEVLSYNRF